MDSLALLKAILLLSADNELVLQVDGKKIVSMDIDAKHSETENTLFVNLLTNPPR